MRLGTKKSCTKATTGNAIYLPKPRDLFACARVMAIDGVPLPVIHIHLLHTAQHQLQLALVEVFQPF